MDVNSEHKVEPVDVYVRRLWRASDQQLHNAASLATSPSDMSFCATFLAGNLLLYAASIAGNATGDIAVPQLTAKDTSPDASGGYLILGLSAAVREAGLRYARYEDYGRYELAPQATTMEEVRAWAETVRAAFRAKYGQFLESNPG